MGYATVRNAATELRPNGDQQTTSATAVSVPGMSMTLEANARYRIMGGIRVGCNNTGGVRLAASVPAGTTLALGLTLTTTGNNVFVKNALVASATLSTNSCCQEVNANRWFEIIGTITTGVTSGMLQVQFASGVAGQTSTAYLEGSSVLVTRVA
jgi:hypothetical protein